MNTNEMRKKLDYLMSQGIPTKLISNQTNINVGTLYNFKKGFQNISKDKEQTLSNFINDCEIYIEIKKKKYMFDIPQLVMMEKEIKE